MPVDDETPVREPEIADKTSADGRGTVQLSGAWDIRSLEAGARRLVPELARRKAADAWDLRQVQRLDHVGALLLWRAWQSRRPQGLSLRPEHESFFANLGTLQAPPPIGMAFSPLAPIRALGDHAVGLLGAMVEGIRLIGQVVLDFGALLRHPLQGPWREISATIYRAGAQALVITALVGFLIGIVLAYRPMLAAILVAGRSGSAMTAQLGVMRVTEELDALSVMGIPLAMRLIFPKVVALAIVLPLLVLWTNAIGLVGAALAAQWQLDIGVHMFFEMLPTAVPAVNLWLGLGKGAVFGVLIALISCHYGLRIEPNTESLGAGTTRSVVASITTVIIVDAIFAVLFADIGMALQ